MKRGTAGKCASFLFGIWYKKGLVMCTQYFGRVNRESFTKIINKTVCSYHVMYAFQSESTLYSYLNVKKLLAQIWRDIWRLNDNKGIRTHHHLVREWTLKYLSKLAKWLSYVVLTYQNDAFDCMLLSCHVQVSESISLKLHISRLFWAMSSLTFSRL